MNRTIMFVFVLVFVSACSPKMWTRPDTAREEFLEDKRECRQMASAAGSGNPLIINSEFNGCMKDYGYTLGVPE